VLAVCAQAVAVDVLLAVWVAAWAACAWEDNQANSLKT
jgi:hypothetical protein